MSEAQSSDKENLWNTRDLHKMGHAIKKKDKLKDMKVLDEVSVLLHVTNQIEENAVMCHLEPLNQDEKIYQYTEQDDNSKAKKVAYLIGKYGACTVAVAPFKHAITALNFNCFKSLNTIISVGVIYGVKNNAEICDVLVAEKIINYGQDGVISSENNTSEILFSSKIFGRNIEWMDKSVTEHLNKCREKVSPTVKKGLILSVPNKELIQQFVSDSKAIGIEEKKTDLDLFKADKVIRHIITVKAVCDFGNDQNKEQFTPVAAYLAANCVRSYLDSSEVPKLLSGTGKSFRDENKVQQFTIGSESKSIFPLPDKYNILTKVIVLLLTMDTNENNAAFHYLQPLPGYAGVYKYMQNNTSEVAIYHIGKYGTCPVAVRQIEPESACTAPVLASMCFKNLRAIIGMGAACGEKSLVKIFDVLIAKKVNLYLTRKIPTSGLLTSLFSQNLKWVDNDIKVRLNGAQPKIQHGEILCGCKHIINNEKKIQDVAPDAIGFDIKAADLFAEAENVPVHMTIVKGVYSFKDGHEDKSSQLTAALLAANYVKKVFDDPQVPDMLQNSDDHEDYDPSDFDDSIFPPVKRMKPYTSPGDDFPDNNSSFIGYYRQGSVGGRRLLERSRKVSTSSSVRRSLYSGKRRRHTEGESVSSFDLLSKIFSPIKLEKRKPTTDSMDITMSSSLIRKRSNSL